MVLCGGSIVLVVWAISLQGGGACRSWLLGGEWNKQVNNKYNFTARLLGCSRLVTRRKL